MKCTNCKKTIPAFSKFCEFCGHSLKVEKPMESTEQKISLEENKGFFNKRIGRKYYWMTLIVYGVLTGLLSQLGEEGGVSFGEGGDVLIAILWFVVLGYYLLVILWRFNDLGKSKWYIFGLLIPIVNIILGFGLAFEKGKLHKSISEQAK